MIAGRPPALVLAVMVLLAVSCAPVKLLPSTPPAAPAAIARLAQNAIAMVGAVSPAWKGWSPKPIPFCIVGPREQWLFLAPKPPPRYDTVAYTSPLGPVYRAEALTTPDGSRAPPPAAFFGRASEDDGSIWFFIAEPQIPLPDGKSRLSVADWTEVFVHEYFHTFQLLEPAWKLELEAMAAK